MTHETQYQPDNLPSGIRSSEAYRTNFPIDESVLPWLHEPYPLSIVHCVTTDNTEFLLGSVIKSHSKLVKAANDLSPHQNGIVDNMFYARLAGYLNQGAGGGNVDTFPNAVTDFAIHVMRNTGGQRAYFGIPHLPVGPQNELLPVVLRLAVCDKNRQAWVMQVLSSRSYRENRRLIGKN